MVTPCRMLIAPRLRGDAMKIALTVAAAWLFLGTSAAAQDRPWTFGELLQSLHVAAYASPGICPESDEIALYTFNATGRHPSRSATTMSRLTYSIVGFRDDGEVIVLPEDQNRVLPNDFPAGQEAIRCIKSAARGQGATEFAIRFVSVGVPRGQ